MLLPKPRQTFNVPHVQQSLEWDCGLACVCMVLETLGTKVMLNHLHRRFPSKSVWTIDLAYLLAFFKVLDFTYYTAHVGFNFQHRYNAFYKDEGPEQQQRIHTLFASAEKNHIRIIPKPLSLDDFRAFLECGRYMILLLVNAQCLKPLGLFSCCFHSSNDFLGHYILLIGYLEDSDTFIARDPAVDYPDTFLSSKLLEEARSSQGTDHDCIVVQFQ